MPITGIIAVMMATVTGSVRCQRDGDKNRAHAHDDETHPDAPRTQGARRTGADPFPQPPGGSSTSAGKTDAAGGQCHRRDELDQIGWRRAGPTAQVTIDSKADRVGGDEANVRGDRSCGHRGLSLGSGRARRLVRLRQRDVRQAAESAATMAPKSAAFRLAPPTSAPSTCGTAKISAAFEGFTDPP